ncbi:MAG: DUF4349 domain-containing protein [Bacteroidota bacterium]
MKILSFLLMSSFMIACQSQPGGGNFSSDTASRAETTSYQPQQTTEAKDITKTEVTEQKLIRKAFVNMEVKSLDNSLPVIESIIQSNGLTIENSKEIKNYYRVEKEMTLRVKPELLDTIIEQFTALALNIDQKSIETDDVTQQYVDIETRLATKRSVVKRYQELLAKAQSVEEILQVEEKLRLVIEEIESAEAQMRYLSSQVQLSTINLKVYESIDSTPTRNRSFGKRIVNAFGDGWEFILETIIVVIQIWPVILGILLIIFLILRSGRRNKKKKTKE